MRIPKRLFSRSVSLAVRHFLYPSKANYRGPLEFTPNIVFAQFVFLLSYWSDLKLLRTRWVVKPLETLTLTPTTRGDLIEMAIGDLSINGSTLVTSRILKRSNKNSYGIAVRWNLDSGLNSRAGFITLAEDPRIFVFQGELWLYYQIPIQGASDCQLFIFNPLRNLTIQLRVDRDFSGKNWAPFEFGGELHFVYSFAPFILYRAKVVPYEEAHFIDLEIVDCAMFTMEGLDAEWRDNFGFGAIRGGTSLVEIEPGVFAGFTHINKGGRFEKSHQIGYLEINLTLKKVKHREITKQKMNLLTAPYGIDLMENTKIRINYNCSVGSVSNQYQPITNRKSTFLLSDLRFGA